MSYNHVGGAIKKLEVSNVTEICLVYAIGWGKSTAALVCEYGALAARIWQRMTKLW